MTAKLLDEGEQFETVLAFKPSLTPSMKK